MSGEEAERCVIEGRLRTDGLNKWRIFLSNGETVSLAGGMFVDIKIGAVWHMTGIIEFRNEIKPTLRGVAFYHNQRVRIKWPST